MIGAAAWSPLRRTPIGMRASCVIVSAALLGPLMCATASAADAQAGAPEEIRISALRDPDARKYKVIVAGLDAFDRHHRLAPGVDTLRFRIAPRGAADLVRAPGAQIVGDGGFSLPLAVDANGMFTVPRSQAALDADGELILNQRRRLHAAPVVRTPGLPDNVRRLGDLRLECQAWMAIRKEEIGLVSSLMVNGVLRQRDWCAFSDSQRPGFSFDAPGRIVRATIREGERSGELQVEGRSYRAPLHDPAWSDDALVELVFDSAGAALTETAGETPRTAP